MTSHVTQASGILCLSFRLSRGRFRLHCAGRRKRLCAFPSGLCQISVSYGRLLSTGFRRTVVNNVRRVTIRASYGVFVVSGLACLYYTVRGNSTTKQLVVRLGGLGGECTLSVLILTRAPGHSLSYPVASGSLTKDGQLCGFFSDIFAVKGDTRSKKLHCIGRLGIHCNAFSRSTSGMVICRVSGISTFLRFIFENCSARGRRLGGLNSGRSDRESYRVLRLSRSNGSIERVTSRIGYNGSAMGHVVRHDGRDGGTNIPDIPLSRPLRYKAVKRSKATSGRPSGASWTVNGCSLRGCGKATAQRAYPGYKSERSFICCISRGGIPLRPSINEYGRRDNYKCRCAPGRCFRRRPRREAAGSFSFSERETRRGGIGRRDGPATVNCVPPRCIRGSRDRHDGFFHFLFALLASCCNSGTGRILGQLLRRCHLKTAHSNSIVF